MAINTHNPIGIPEFPPVAQPKVKEPSKVEVIKEHSDYLREPLATELEQDTTHFTEAAIQVLKFHGAYQQDNRDIRQERSQAGLGRDFRMMLRTRQTAGIVPPELYLILDRLADAYGYGNLRVTTRQAFQLHGILKDNLKTVIGTIVRSMQSTLAACGDVERNIMAPAAPYRDRAEYRYAQEYSFKIADLLAPHTSSYLDIWVDGEAVPLPELDADVRKARQMSSGRGVRVDSKEPLLGKHYLPRKFKSAITVPGDNSVDIYTQDLGFIVMTDDLGQLEGFNVLVGGGMGRTHKKEQTFPLLAKELGFVPVDLVYELAQAIVAVQRDHGDRSDRRHARMKYLVNDWGIDKFRQVVEQYYGREIAPCRPMPPFEYKDYLGWHEQGDGKWFLGISIENGRVKDEGKFQLKTALRTLVERYELPMHLTPHQNIILAEIDPSWRADINSTLRRCGILQVDRVSPLLRLAMACPALPTCGLARTESERVIGSVAERIEKLLYQLDLADQTFQIRMTGCPNGCARPYMAELGLVGNTPGHYQVWLAGSPRNDRLARLFTEKVHIDALTTFLLPMLQDFKRVRRPSENFGDYCDRVGFDYLRTLEASEIEPLKPAKPPRRSTKSVQIRQSAYDRLKAEAQAQGVSLADLASQAIEAFLN
ncbi:MAG: sulfite reductase, ferredoxin dependent [Cyanobacteria bacterium P01_D01_bin.123]